jgi:hypothetical protein
MSCSSLAGWRGVDGGMRMEYGNKPVVLVWTLVP